MGQHADDILNGDVDQYSGEWIGGGQGYPRSKQSKTYIQHSDGRVTDIDHDPKQYAKGTKAIRKELAILIKEKHKSCSTDKEKRIAVEEARQEINKKYGKGWREQY